MKKKLTTDFIYTLSATLIYNTVLQIIVYPLINTICGQIELGKVTYFMSIVNIAALAIGAALCNNRLALGDKFKTTNGDFLLFLFVIIPIAIIISFFILYSYFDIVDMILYALLMVFICLRSYGCVQYRLVVSYKHLFFMYLVSSVGYIIGILFYSIIKRWEIIFLVGELAGCIYIYFTGKVLIFDKISYNIKKVFISSSILTLSSLVLECTTNADKIILSNFDSAITVSIYYTISSVPKILYLLSQPINNIVLTYSSNNSLVLNKKSFIKLSIVFIGIAVVFYGVSLIGIPIFMNLLYPDIWSQSIQYMYSIPIIIIIDLLCVMISNLIFAKFGSKYHLLIFGSYILYYCPLAIFGTITGGISGFIDCAIIAELIKLFFVMTVGIIKFRTTDIEV